MPEQPSLVLSPTELLGVAHRISAQPELWKPWVRHDPLQRTYQEVARTSSYSAWLICWMPGHDTGFHDHDGASGLGLVLEGQVAEAHLALGGAEPEDRVLSRGQHFAFSAHDIHRVRHVGIAPASTLHVYTPVLQRMGSYQVQPNGTLQRQLLGQDQELRAVSVG